MTMPPSAMPLDRLRALLDAYGARPARWPEAEREAALALLRQSAEARAARDRAAGLDAALDRAPSPPPGAALLGAVLAARPRRAGWRQSLFGQMPAWQPALALLLAAVVGFGLGRSGTLAPQSEAEMEVDIAALSLSIDPDEAEAER